MIGKQPCLSSEISCGALRSHQLHSHFPHQLSPRRPRQRYFIAFIALGIVMLNANSHHPPYEVGKPPYLTLFLIDGCSQRVLFEELASSPCG